MNLIGKLQNLTFVENQTTFISHLEWFDLQTELATHKQEFQTADFGDYMEKKGSTFKIISFLQIRSKMQ